MNICTTCAAQLEPLWSFCYSCGVIVPRAEQPDIECGKHPGSKAVGFCVVCSTPVCDECKELMNGKILCSDPAHRNILQEWQILSRPESEFEADSLVRNLLQGGIDAKTFSLHDHAGARWMSEQRVLLFVKKPEVRNAAILLQELGLLDTE